MTNEIKKVLADYPELLLEWDYSKNADLDPQKIMHRSKTKAWWKCPEGHEWRAGIANRTYGSGCPTCAAIHREEKRNAKRITEAGSLLLENPILATEWHPEKNGALKPSDVLPSSNKKIWWRCSKGHEWQATVTNRNDRNSNCPYCSGLLVIPGVNDLATIFPQLAAEWHPLRNGELTPSDIKARSGKKVWWLCSSNHEWIAEIKARSNGNGCPVCDRIKRTSKQHTR